jgi:hypothetical protein
MALDCLESVEIFVTASKYLGVIVGNHSLIALNFVEFSH